MIFYGFDNVRLLLLLLVSVLVTAFIIPVYALHGSTFSELKTDKLVYDDGDTIIISGIVNNTAASYISEVIHISIYHDRGVKYSDNIYISQNGTFSHSIIAGGESWEGIGEYWIIGTYNGEISISKFNYTGTIIIPPIITTHIFKINGTNSETFDVEYIIENGSVENMVFDFDSSILEIEIISTDFGSIILNLPRNLIDAVGEDGSDHNFIVIGDGVSLVAYYEDLPDPANFRKIIIDFQEGHFNMIIIGT